MSSVDKVTTEPMFQSFKSTPGKKNGDGSFAELLDSAKAKAQPVDTNLVEAPFPGGCMEPMQFPVSDSEPFRSADQLLNKFLAKAGRHVHFAEISAAYAHIRHELKTSGQAVPSSAQDIFVRIIGMAAEFEENSNGNPDGLSPLRQQLAQFVQQA